MTFRNTHLRCATFVFFGLCAATALLPDLLAQQANQFNEREVKADGQQAADEAKAGDWTLDFRFKDPRLIKVNIPGRGTRICWYMWYQIVNRTNQPRTFFPDFELVTLDIPGTYHDEALPTVEAEIKKLEDPTGYQDIKNSVSISAAPIPVPLAPDKAFPKAVTGVAIWDGTPADPKDRTDKVHDLSDSQRFSIFVTGLSSGWVQVDPLGKGKVAAPVIRRKTLQLNFKRVGDKFHLDSRDISFVAPAEWIYRSSRLAPAANAPGGPPMEPSKDEKKAGGPPMAPALNPNLQPELHRGN
jgi:hypothetical protein